MKRLTKRTVAIVGVAVLGWAGAPAAAGAADAQLYEMTENMKITASRGFQLRKATSELIGTANVGTPLCPAALVAAVNPGAATCTVNATGTDNISLTTGLGTFSGNLTVVVQGDNRVDSPEFVVMTASFKGNMDFSPAILLGIPLGHVTGKMVLPSRGGTFPFTGTFRLPFVLPAPDAALFADLPLPLNPMDNYDVTQTTRPVYLLDDMQNIEPVQAREFGGGWATVKFEISF